jgi:hypothetical protein
MVQSYKSLFCIGSEKQHGHVSIQDRKIIFVFSATYRESISWDEFSIFVASEMGEIVIRSTLKPKQFIRVRDVVFGKVIATEMDVKVHSELVHWWSRRPLVTAAAAGLVLCLVVVLFLGFVRGQGRFIYQFITAE